MAGAKHVTGTGEDDRTDRTILGNRLKRTLKCAQYFCGQGVDIPATVERNSRNPVLIVPQYGRILLQKFLGKKGSVAQLLRSIGELDSVTGPVRRIRVEALGSD